MLSIFCVQWALCGECTQWQHWIFVIYPYDELCVCIGYESLQSMTVCGPCLVIQNEWVYVESRMSRPETSDILLFEDCCYRSWVHDQTWFMHNDSRCGPASTWNVAVVLCFGSMWSNAFTLCTLHRVHSLETSNGISHRMMMRTPPHQMNLDRAWAVHIELLRGLMIMNGIRCELIWSPCSMHDVSV